MNEVELESLMVRVKGDSTHYENALRSAQEATGRFVESVVRVGEAFGIERLMHGSFEKFEQFETAHLRTAAVLEANGRDVAALTEEYRGYADQLVRVSTMSRAQAMNLLQTAEGYRVTGAAAGQAAREAAALAALTGHSAESMVRLSAAMARGDLQAAEHMGRLVPQLRNIRDPAEFAAQYLKLVAAGTKLSGEEAVSAGGKLAKLRQAWEEVQVKLGEVVSEGIKPFLDHAMRVADVLKTLPSEFYEWAAGIGAALAGLLVLRPALYLVGVALGPLVSVVSGLFDGAVTVASTVAWAAWAGVVLVAKGVVLLYNLAVVATNFVVALLSGNLGIATFATWALDAAMAVLTFSTLAPLVITVVALAGAAVVLGAAFYAVYKAGRAVYTVFSEIGTSSGPFKAIKDLADQWYERLQRIVEVAQTDLPGAWGLAQRAFTLGVAELRDLWPPLWEFVQQGWKVTAEVSSGVFRLEFLRAMNHVQLEVERIFARTVGLVSPYLQQQLEQSIADELKGIDQLVDEKTKAMTDKAAEQFKRMVEEFKTTQSEATKKAMEEYEKFDLFLKVRAAFRKMFKDVKKDQHESGIGEINITPKFDAAAWNSAEMRTRVEQWRDKMGLGNVATGEALRDQKNRADADRIWNNAHGRDRVPVPGNPLNVGYQSVGGLGGGIVEALERTHSVLEKIEKNTAKKSVEIVSGEMSQGVF